MKPSTDPVATTASYAFSPGRARTLVAVVAAAIAATGPAPAASDTPLPTPISTVVEAEPRLADLRSEILTQVETGRLPSFAVGVIQDGRVLWLEALGWADVGAGVPATSATSYRLASLGKSITATGLLTLAQSGRVDLDEPVESYFAPSARLTAHEGHARDVTVRSVLHMTAAIPHGELGFRSRDDFDAYTTAEMVRHRGVVIFPPGEAYVYSNFTYGMLEHVIEQVADVSFAKFLRSNVFEPLGMTESVLFPDDVADGVRLATLYDAPGEPAERLFVIPQSSLGIYASVSDLLQYARFHLKQPLTGGRAILTDEWLDRMHRERPGLSRGESLMTLGWGSIDLPGMLWLLSNGRATGAQSTLTMIPSEDLAVVCLTNVTGNATDEMAFRITEALVPGFLEQAGRMQVEWEAKTGRAYKATSELVGTWSGVIHQSGGVLPLEILIQADGDVHVSLENQYITLLNGVRYEDGLLTGEFVGECAAEQSVDHPHLIRLGLHLQDGRLSGFAAPILANEAGSFALPMYIALERHDAPPAGE